MSSCLLLIGGSPRSGTTAVLQMLNSSPGVFISSEENLLKSLQSLEKLLDTRSRRAKAMEKGMRALSPRETLTLENIHSHNFDRESVWPTLRFIYEYHHERLHPGLPLVLWGDKLPAYARELDAVLALHGVRYMHVTRNPFDVVNSMLRRLDAARQGQDWWKAITDFDAMVEAWAESYRAIEAVEKRANVFHLHYEELVFDFERNVAALNHFLGVDMQYQNVLVSDPALHYDRSHLTREMIQRIDVHPVVQNYIVRYRGNSNLPNVASALKPLLV
jgi:hypothetical protein